MPSPVGEVCAFFSEARNLKAITPAWLWVRILTSGLVRIAAGTPIRCRLSWHGIPLGRTTEIRQWNPLCHFVDVQLDGPYRLWHHTHRFEANDGGSLMTDIVRCRLPLGIAGRALHRLKVRRDVERIFDYRFQRIHESSLAVTEEAK